MAQRTEGDGEGPVAGVGVAVPADIHVVCCGVAQTCEGERVVAVNMMGSAEVRRSARGDTDHIELGGLSTVPGDKGIVETDVADGDIRHTRACGDVVYGEVIEVGVAVFAIGRHQCDVSAVAGVVVEVELEGLPLRQTGIRGATQFGERGDIVGVGHHTHFHGVGV